MDSSLRVNDRIRAPIVLVIGEDGEKLGDLALMDARRLAADRGLDLVEIVPNRMPPVCKIMNYGRFVYQQSKKSQDSKRHQKQNQVKEVKFRIIIGEHDRATKMKQIERFLHEGHKVKATIWFKRARERSRRELGDRILDEVTAQLAEIATVESRSSVVGNQMSMILAPSRRLLEALRTERAGRAGPEDNPQAPRVRRAQRDGTG
ncbi:MAG: translation initiation factor IF-3 [Acidobacteria bacterium]|nr:translation initiation factor IF-3 [Acidobacteriota bacterium]MYE43390.1 translation initiation factor IF-3 [Acidobacteriota bacterium]